MIVIRDAQMTALSTLPEDQFQRSMAEFLRGHFPEAAAAPAGELTQFVGAQFKKAKSYGLDSQHAAAVYISTAWMMGDGFDDKSPVVQAELSNTSVPAESRAFWLEEWCWQAIDARQQMKERPS